MKMIMFLTFFLISLTAGRPQQNTDLSKDAVILKYESESDGYGQYHFLYETSDKQTRQEQGTLREPGTENEAISVTGSFSFLGQDGVLYTVRYTADDKGFRPEGDHLPSSRKKLVPVEPQHHFQISEETIVSLIGGVMGFSAILSLLKLGLQTLETIKV